MFITLPTGRTSSARSTTSAGTNFTKLFGEPSIFWHFICLALSSAVGLGLALPDLVTLVSETNPKVWYMFLESQIHDKQGILKGEVSLHHWPPVWLVWNQLYDIWQFLFLLQNRRILTSQTGGQWYSDTSTFSIPRDKYQLFQSWGGRGVCVNLHKILSELLISECKQKVSILCKSVKICAWVFLPLNWLTSPPVISLIR